MRLLARLQRVWLQLLLLLSASDAFAAVAIFCFAGAAAAVAFFCFAAAVAVPAASLANMLLLFFCFTAATCLATMLLLFLLPTFLAFLLSGMWNVPSPAR